MYSKVILISLFIYISSKSYSFSDYSMKEKYIPMTINTTKYNSSSPCVTFDDLVAFHYTLKTQIKMRMPHLRIFATFTLLITSLEKTSLI